MRNGHAIAPAERIAFCRDLNIGFSEVFGFLQREGYAINSKERLITACYALGLNSEEAEAILHIKDGTIRAYKKHVKDRLPSDIATLLFSSK